LVTRNQFRRGFANAARSAASRLRGRWPRGARAAAALLRPPAIRPGPAARTWAPALREHQARFGRVRPAAADAGDCSTASPPPPPAVDPPSSLLRRACASGRARKSSRRPRMAGIGPISVLPRQYLARTQFP